MHRRVRRKSRTRDCVRTPATVASEAMERPGTYCCILEEIESRSGFQTDAQQGHHPAGEKQYACAAEVLRLCHINDDLDRRAFGDWQCASILPCITRICPSLIVSLSFERLICRLPTGTQAQQIRTWSSQ